MYSLDRTKKANAVVLALSILSFALSAYFYFRGGYDLFEYENWLRPALLMGLTFLMGILLLILFFIVRAIQKDMAEHLRYLNTTRKEN